MLLVKKFNFFIYFFWSEKGLEIKFNDALDEKETFFVHKNKVFQRLKNRIFPKGLTHALVKKCNVLNLFSVKKGLEIRFNDVLDIKETFFYYKNKNFSTSQKSHFFHFSIWLKNAIFFINCFRSK